MIEPTEAPSHIRAVTDDEIEHFFENGWTTLRGLFTPELAASLLAIAQERMGESGNEAQLRDKDIDSSWFKDYHDPSRENELFWAVATAPVMGRNAALLLGRDAPMLFLTDLLAVKLPAEESGRGAASDFHQDYNLLPFDVTSTNLWIALDEVTPEQGPLQFYSGSHRLGKLGKPGDYPAKWPRVRKYTTLSEPNHLMPGDATIHGSLTIHGAGENLSQRPRWAYISAYLPADARFTNLPYRHTQGLGLKPFETVDNPKFPRIYNPEPALV
jgi:ectoine hydroxylase-related dioxygenase (phytanoyl-CoA dioxygenase family)